MASESNGYLQDEQLGSMFKITHLCDQALANFLKSLFLIIIYSQFQFVSKRVG